MKTVILFVLHFPGLPPNVDGMDKIILGPKQGTLLLSTTPHSRLYLLQQSEVFAVP